MITMKTDNFIELQILTNLRAIPNNHNFHLKIKIEIFIFLNSSWKISYWPKIQHLSNQDS